MSVKIEKGITLGSLSLTPLIDVVFLLLIFFLVATRFEEEERELDVALAEASHATPLIVQPEELFVHVTNDGRYYLGDSLLDYASLKQALSHAWMQNPGRQRVIIRADKESKTKHLVAVMNACNSANIRDYSIAAE